MQRKFLFFVDTKEIFLLCSFKGTLLYYLTYQLYPTKPTLDNREHSKDRLLPPHPMQPRSDLLEQLLNVLRVLAKHLVELCELARPEEHLRQTELVVAVVQTECTEEALNNKLEQFRCSLTLQNRCGSSRARRSGSTDSYWE
jgi:hypothetical protein